MKNVLVRLNEFQKASSPTDKAIIAYIIENSEVVTQQSIHELAEATFTSPSSIVRLCKKIDMKGFKEFKNSLISEVAIRKLAESSLDKELTKTDNVEAIVDTITQLNTSSLEKTRQLIDVSIMKICITLIFKAQNLAIFGLGSSQIVARDAQQKFMRIHKRCFVYEDWHMQFLNAQSMNQNDVGLIISYSGETEEMIKCAQEMKRNGVPIIAVTRYVSSRLTKLADYNLYVAADESMIRSGAMASRISQLNIIDILYTGCANMNYDYSLEWIYKTHFRKGEENDQPK